MKNENNNTPQKYPSSEGDLKSSQKIFLSLIVLLLGVGLGVLAALSSWSGKIYFFRSETYPQVRKPSSLLEGEEVESSQEDISAIQSYEWSQSSPESLLANAFVELTDEGAYVSFGHFLVQNQKGEKSLACHVYNKIKAVFHSGDIAINGSPCVMNVQFPCLISKEDSKNIQAFYLPLQWLYNEVVPKNETFSFTENDITYHLAFENMGFNWPKLWYLKSIRLYQQEENPSPSEEISKNLLGEREKNEEDEDATGSSYQKHHLENLKEKQNLLAEEEKEETQDNLDSSLQNDLSSHFKKEWQFTHKEILEIRGDPLTVPWGDSLE